MNTVELKSQIDEFLAKPFNAKVLLNTARLINENDRRTSAYTDPNYIPFYYHLGKLIQPKSVVEIGLRLGLTGAAFTRSCHSVERYLALQESNAINYYSVRLAKANIRDHFKGELYTHVGSIEDDGFSAMLESQEWDLGIVNDEVGYDHHLLILETVWERIAMGGWLVCDYVASHRPAKRAWDGFCKARNRTPEFFPTRYGVSIVQK
jgi:predicted O-methyltransferase YrrM